MSSQRIIRFILLTCFVFLFGLSSVSLAEDTENQETEFVDLDGDGLNDHVKDMNNNGIPDNFESKKDTEAEENQADDQEQQGFATIQPVNTFDLTKLLPNSEQFTLLQFTTRSISLCRGGIERGDNFGSGSGTDSPGASGCPGGVCPF